MVDQHAGELWWILFSKDVYICEYCWVYLWHSSIYHSVADTTVASEGKTYGSHEDVIKWQHFFRVPGPLRGEFTGHRWISLTKASDAELWCFLWCAPEQTPERIIETPVIKDVMALIMTSVLWFGRQTIHTSSHPPDDFFYGISVKIILLKTDVYIKPHFISKFVIDYFAPMICFLQPNVMAYVRQNIRLCRVEGLL